MFVHLFSWDYAQMITPQDADAAWSPFLSWGSVQAQIDSNSEDTVN